MAALNLAGNARDEEHALAVLVDEAVGVGLVAVSVQLLDPGVLPVLLHIRRKWTKL